MKVKALTGFAAMLDGQMVSRAPGDVFELPAGVDWLRAGLVAVVEPVIASELPPLKTPFSEEMKADIIITEPLIEMPAEPDQIGPAATEPEPAAPKGRRKKKGS